MRRIKILKYFILIVILFIGFHFIKAQWDQNKAEDYGESMIPTVKEYIRLNFDNVESITIKKITLLPTGNVFVKGYINNDVTLEFSVDSPYRSNRITGMMTKSMSSYKKKNGVLFLDKID